MRFSPSLLASFFLLPLSLMGESSDESLHQLFEEVTSIATKTKLNADYVPGTVSVISGEKLKSLGINNLAEQNAFDMIVGFDSSTLSLRGAGSIYGSQGNKIKWMINDKPISAEIWGMPKLGVGQIVFPIPTDAIDRIEIIRGAGSAIYGGNAIYGVINIITKKESKGVFSTLSQTESHKYGRSIGAYGSFENNGLEVSTVLSTEKHDGWDLSATSQSRSQHGNLPNAHANNLFMVDLSYRHLDFWAYRMEAENNYARLQWDPANYLPQDNRSPVQSNTYTLIGVQGEFNLAPNVTLVTKAGINEYTNKAEVVFFPSTVLVNSNPDHKDGVRYIDYIESIQYVESFLTATLDSHRLLAGLYAGFTTVDRDDTLQTYTNSTTYNPGVSTTLLKANHPKRNNKAIYLQDEIELDDRNTITIGARYDSYSDGHTAFSPRLGYLYLHDDSNIFKAQYSRAFRPPSFAEQFSRNNLPANPRFEPETVDTVELSYIFKQKNRSLKTTALYSKTSDMITFHNWSYETINLSKPATIKGVELEFAEHYDSMNYGINLAYYKTHQGEILYHNYAPAGRNYAASEFALSANFLANAYLSVNTDTAYPTTLWYHYTGSKNRVSTDLVDDLGNVVTNGGTNGSVPAQDYLNVTQKINNITKGLDMEFGVKNVFGKTLRTLYFPLNRPNNSDVPYMKQSFWINLHYRF